jgi:hypothetical protein
MTKPSRPELRCPFCHTALAPHVAECHRCHAKRHTRRGMTLRNFRLYVATWLGLSVPLLLLACWIGFAPWAPGKPAPGYALALIGAKASAQDLSRCRVEVVGSDGSRTEKLVEGACGSAITEAPVAMPTGPSMTERRLATALHSVLCLLAGVAASALLLLVLRRPFTTKAAPSWVRRAAV